MVSLSDTNHEHHQPSRCHPAHALPKDNPHPPDPNDTKRAHISEIPNENGSGTKIWHYRLTKFHERDQPNMSPHEMLVYFANFLYENDNHFSILHQKTEEPTTVTASEIEADSDIGNFTSSCSSLKGARATILLVSITNNNPNIQHGDNPIADLVHQFEAGWYIFPDIFCGLRSGMVGVFTNVLPEGVNWRDSAAMITQEVKRLLDQPDRVRVEVTPARFYWEDNGRTQQVAVVAVYAPMRNKAEVQGISIHLAFDKSDRVDPSLASSQFHNMT